MTTRGDKDITEENDTIVSDQCRAVDTINNTTTVRTAQMGGAFWNGVRAMLPIMLGVIPFGLIAGVAAINAGMSKSLSVAYSIIVLAGASQLAAADLIGAGAPALVIIMTALIINLRFVMYSATLAPQFKKETGAWKILLAYLLTDQAFAISMARFQKEIHPDEKRWFFFGGGLTLAVIFAGCTAIGVFLGAKVPASWALEFAVPLTFMGLMFPVITDKPTAAAAVSAGFMSVLAHGLPQNLGLVVAAVTGIFIGLLVESWRAS